MRHNNCFSYHRGGNRSKVTDSYLRYVLHIFLFIFCLHTVCAVMRVQPETRPLFSNTIIFFYGSTYFDPIFPIRPPFLAALGRVCRFDPTPNPSLGRGFDREAGTNRVSFDHKISLCSFFAIFTRTPFHLSSCCMASFISSSVTSSLSNRACCSLISPSMTFDL